MVICELILGHSPVRSSLAAAFSIILNAAPVDPDEGAKPANFVMRILLEDIIAIRTATTSSAVPAQTVCVPLVCWTELIL